MSHIKVDELKSVKDGKSPIKAEDVIAIGKEIVNIFPDGVNLKNMSEATIKVLAKVSMYKLN